MPVSFEKLVEGKEYDRPHLAELWGYRGFQAISRGVVTPAKTKFIILFVTKEKQISSTQYEDYLDGSYLHWEGEAKHSSDDRVIKSVESGDETHLFYREKHHSPFIYKGVIELEQHNRMVDAPSQFIFTLAGIKKTEIEEESAMYNVTEYIEGDDTITATEKNAIIKSRIGQGVFRDSLLRLWGGCAVTGFRKPILLLASHIKPWRISTNKERLDPYNGLLLQPTIDRLFDTGLVSFDQKGGLIKSEEITTGDLIDLGIDPRSRLLQVPNATMQYLKYHRENEFKS